tara:strand:+ start:257 stop:784 length:528 start_codon:yes stop_codon:yes gene_type:complete
METLVYSNFKNLTNKNGIYAILDLDSCFACNEYMKELKKYDKEHWTIIAMSEEDTLDFIETEGLKPPITRIYVNDRVQYEVGGVLYPKQIITLYEEASKYGLMNVKGQEMKTPLDFNIITARHKSVNVQSFQCKDYMSIDLLGQEVVARKNQWIVMYPDNHIEVLDTEAYMRRFE